MSQLHLYACDKRAVDPFLGSDAACLTYHSTEIASCETHAFSIVTDVMVLRGILIDEIDEAIEDSLLAGHGCLKTIVVLMVEMVVVIHLCCDKTADCLAVIVFLMYNVP